MRLFLFFSFLILLISCSSKRDVVLLQDYKNFNSKNFSYKEILIKPGDILKIDVSSVNAESVIQFNKPITNSNFNSIELLKMQGYNVYNDGTIIFPVIGSISVSGLSPKQLSEKIFNILEENKLLNNHKVEVKIISSSFTVLGEVNKPGNYTFLKNNLNLNEAIGIAGDITINAKRDNILLIREDSNKKNIFEINLKNTNYLNSELYQVLPGDVIIVNPNLNRIKSAGIIGNSGTLISLLSFIVSIVILTSNN